jgi:hypothetical protein
MVGQMDEELADVVAVEDSGRLVVVETVVATQPTGVSFEGGGAEVAQFALGAEHVNEGYGFCHGQDTTRRIAFHEKKGDLLAGVGVKC